MLGYVVLYLFVFAFGIIIGSFLNVCIYRLPKEESLITGASHCMACGKKIKKYDLIPVFSYIILKGKCRGCGEKISIRYPIVELINGLLWLLVFFTYDFSFKAITISLLFSALVVVFFMDWDTQLISTPVVIFIGALSVPYYFLDSGVSPLMHILGAFVVSLPLLAIELLSKGRAMGRGDVYLMAAAGLFLGAKLIAVAFFFGLLSGSVAGLIIKYKTKSSKFAFGPFLSLGIAASLLYGDKIVNAYLSFLGVVPR
ncbi:MAG: prepilin peptidase [Oscillospiraceae bacterium]|jgi:leader peptidase (prepilin peptidase)/N-methyltransferase